MSRKHSPQRSPVVLYVIELLDGSLYVGSTTNLDKRFDMQCSLRRDRDELRPLMQSRAPWRRGCWRLRMDLAPKTTFDFREDAVLAEERLARSLRRRGYVVYQG